MNWLDFIALTLAAGAVVNVWKNGSIFADWRAFIEDKADDSLPDYADTPPATDDATGGEPLPVLMRVVDRVMPRFFAELLSCAFCFSHHTPWLLAMVCFFPTLFITTPWICWLFKLPVYSLAATHLGNLLNSIAPENMRYEQ